jgi:hypothetical protein
MIHELFFDTLDWRLGPLFIMLTLLLFYLPFEFDSAEF